MRNLFLLKLLFQQRPHTLPLALMQTAQTSVRDGSGTAIHAAGRQVVWYVMCVGKIGQRDENHIRDFAAGGKRGKSVHASEKSKGKFVIKAAALAP